MTSSLLRLLRFCLRMGFYGLLVLFLAVPAWLLWRYQSGTEKGGAPPTGGHRAAFSDQFSTDRLLLENPLTRPTGKLPEIEKAEKPSSLSLSVAFRPPVARDPLLSPGERKALTQKGAVSVGSPDPWRHIALQGIIGTRNGIVAILNNQVVSPGAKLQGFRVVEIRKSSVLLSYQGQNKRLHLPKP
ncbi:MAG: hypothetical protein HY402_00660 [Elusimicrobia bacterium]|nr:hypothetical protein [Elusimicrobiota bacterium]